VTLLLTLVAIAGGLLALAGAAYFVLSTWAGLRFRREVRLGATSGYTPPVSILKSLKGIDPHMYAAFASHCALDYPEYELLFGVHDPSEPALALVEKLQQEFPRQALRVIDCPESLGLNGKVSNLAQMLPQARYEHVIINDSDIVVPRDYLRRVMSPFADPAVGMVTTLYRGIAGKTLGSKLEALGLSTDFAGGVLLARAMEGGIRFGLGATIATTKDVLEKIGGLAALANHLGDDYELGARTAAIGRKIALADTVLETALPDYSFRDFWLHQMRWARNVKDRRPGQYVGLIATYGLAWAIIAVLAEPFSWWTWAILAITAVSRFTSAMVVGRGVLNDPQVLPNLWFVPLRDFVALAVWIASYFGDTVVWRGMRFRLIKGKLEPSGR
jgi:ceramide glucosyltransferase